MEPQPFEGIGHLLCVLVGGGGGVVAVDGSCHVRTYIPVYDVLHYVHTYFRTKCFCQHQYRNQVPVGILRVDLWVSGVMI